MNNLLHLVHNPDTWISFLTLSVLEIVLGIDNVIFLAIVANRLDEPQRGPARFVGLILALVIRIAFLWSVLLLVGMSDPVFDVGSLMPPSAPAWLRELQLSWRDLILLAGGLFLVYKALTEIGEEILPGRHQRSVHGAAAFGFVVLQIVALDLVFSIDSVMTAVGLSRQLPIMVAAIVVAIIVMMVASGPVSRFIDRHPRIKMLALAFILVVGGCLVSDGLHGNVPRETLYVLIGVSLSIEGLVLALGQRAVHLGERLRAWPVRLGGLALVIVLGYFLAENLEAVGKSMLGGSAVLRISVSVLVFQAVLFVLNALARRKRLHEEKRGAASP